MTPKRKAALENIPNYAAIVLVLAAVLVDAFSRDHNYYLDSLALVLLLMCTFDVVASVVRSGEVDRLSSLELRLNHLSNAMSDRARIVECPRNKPAAYVELFGGFSGDYYAYNPAYAIEDNPGLSEALVNEVYVPRYKGNCTAFYLFFTKEEKDRRNFERFQALMDAVDKAGCNEAKHKVKVRVNSKKSSASHPEVYFGMQHGRYVVVRDLALTDKARGKPPFYCVSELQGLYDDYNDRFNEDWKDASDWPWPSEPKDAGPQSERAKAVATRRPAREASGERPGTPGALD